MATTQRFGGKVCLEYCWLGGGQSQYFSGFDIRSKTKTVDKVPTDPAELPIWNYDGSSTEQAPGSDSEVLIRPVAIFNDPFRGAPHKLVWCEGFHLSCDITAESSTKPYELMNLIISIY